ncbi:ABC transporter ATP-binding protein [Methanocella sp. CWC-04]|uniref:Cobalamin import ATP-binding protein BtuD n=1 Tax=Methanooceanicella nereidis TaxID=2052831 RepID=A0AAP2W6V9_9EURY|nr:ABC transporter ATP-binding protein [Methanocella sp. CWC-04]MCD1295707.1 ABC transporter ATP-binding protein [Methanocella sp. CWC-04]
MKIIADNVSVYYGKHKALEDISFDVSSGEIVSLVGPNGSGKSTMIKCMAQIHKPSKGKIYLDDRDISKISLKEVARLIGYVPQNFHYLFFSTVMETVLLGRKPHITWSISPRDLEIVQNALNDMGISDLAGKFMDQLSGGQKQKVHIARALAQEPKLFLFDEPTSNLDLKHQMEVLEITSRLAKEEGSSLIIALHDLNLAFNYSDRVVMLRGGKIFAQGKPGDVLTPENIKEVYDVDTLQIKSDYGTHIVPIKTNGRQKA